MTNLSSILKEVDNWIFPCLNKDGHYDGEITPGAKKELKAFLSTSLRKLVEGTRVKEDDSVTCSSMEWMDGVRTGRSSTRKKQDILIKKVLE